jgi:hypothetical protein
VREKRELTHPPEKKSDQENSGSQVELPNPDLNPMVNPTLGRNLGRWAQVYFENAPENRDKAVGDLLRELEDEGGVAQRKGPKSERVARLAEQPPEPEHVELTDAQPQLIERGETPAAPARDVIACPRCKYENSSAQSFCGMCGATLKVSPAAENSVTQRQVPPDNVDWLRDQPLASFRASEEDRGAERNPGGRVVAIMVAILIAVFSWYTWWNRSRADLGPKATQSVATPAAPQGQASPESPRKEPAAEKAADIAAPQHLPAEDAQVEIKSRPVESTPAEIKATAANEANRNKIVSPINSANGEAELATAQSYLYGVNGRKDTQEAAKWLWKAVGKQNRTALLLLADLYQHGDGVAKSCDQAQLLLVAAAKKGLPEAGERLRYLQSAGCK